MTAHTLGEAHPTVPGLRRLVVGCWTGTTTTLRQLVATDDDWPEARGEQCAARRPGLLALADICDAHMAGWSWDDVTGEE